MKWFNSESSLNSLNDKKNFSQSECVRLLYTLLYLSPSLDKEFWDDEKTIKTIVDERYFSEDLDEEELVAAAMEQVPTLHLNAMLHSHSPDTLFKFIELKNQKKICENLY